MPCPICGVRSTDVLQSKLLANGSRRRRYGCRSCNHRWTIWIGDRPQQGQPRGVKRGPMQARPPKLTDEQVRLILTRLDTTDEVMAQRMGRTREAIRQVRVGITYANACPDLPRRGQALEGLTCTTCRHWLNNGCGFQVPDCLTEGIGFARDCSLYET